jgi:hypothetical protein
LQLHDGLSPRDTVRDIVRSNPWRLMPRRSMNVFLWLLEGNVDELDGFIDRDASREMSGTL